MSVYDELDFAPVLITDLFAMHRGKVGERDPQGHTPYVGAAARNNSLVGFVQDEPLFPAGWLALVNNGNGGAGYCTYQPASFFGSADVTALEPLSEELTEPALIILASAITHQCFAKYSFGYKPNMQRLSKQRIMVPATRDNTGAQVVDWDGMTRLGRELLDQALTHTAEAQQADPTDATLPLPDLQFEPMLITEVFESMAASSAWYDKSKLRSSGDAGHPFVSRTKAKNGVDRFCSTQEKEPEPGQVITIGLDTQTINYQPVPFYTGQNIQVLRHTLLSESSGMVLVSSIRQQMSKFSWGGNGATLGRLAATKIMVPVTTDPTSGEQVVDWNGMDQYGRILRARAEQELASATDKLAAQT